MYFSTTQRLWHITNLAEKASLLLENYLQGTVTYTYIHTYMYICKQICRYTIYDSFLAQFLVDESIQKSSVAFHSVSTVCIPFEP